MGCKQIFCSVSNCFPCIEWKYVSLERRWLLCEILDKSLIQSICSLSFLCLFSYTHSKTHISMTWKYFRYLQWPVRPKRNYSHLVKAFCLIVCLFVCWFYWQLRIRCVAATGKKSILFASLLGEYEYYSYIHASICTICHTICVWTWAYARSTLLQCKHRWHTAN